MSIQLAENDAGGIWARILFKKAFQRMGIPLEIILIPESRSYSELMAGHIDGELVRAEQYIEAHPDLLRVKIPDANIKVMVYSSVPIDSWKDLKEKNVRVDFKNGNAAVVGALQKMGMENNERVSLLAEDIQGFKKLASKRTEVFIGYDASTEIILKMHPALARKIKYRKVLNTFSVYTFFSPKHKALAEKLDKTLQKMSEEGEIEKARLEAIKQLIQKSAS